MVRSRQILLAIELVVDGYRPKVLSALLVVFASVASAASAASAVGCCGSDQLALVCQAKMATHGLPLPPFIIACRAISFCMIAGFIRP